MTCWICKPILPGVKELRAWTVKVGATAPEAAGVIHTDFERFVTVRSHQL